MLILVMGVSGTGKTTIGSILAEKLRWDFIDADYFHSEASISKMRSGLPLDDADRSPWLEAIAKEIRRRQFAGANLVLACSALKQKYRDILCSPEKETLVLHLRGSGDLIRSRISLRKGHFMPLELLDSQFDQLEPPQSALEIDISLSPSEIVEKVLAMFGDSSKD